MDSLVNTKIGYITCIEELPSRIMNDGRKYLFVKVKCDCGNTAEIRKSDFKRGLRKSCSRNCSLNKTNYDEYVGKTYKSYTVLKFLEIRNRQAYVLAECKCGNQNEVSLSQLINGYTNGCKNCANRKTVPIGTKFDKLTVKELYIDEKNFTVAVCDCECGNKKKVRLHNLTRAKRKEGSIHSCGCTNKMNLIGQTFGKLTVTSEAEPIKKIYNGKKSTKRRWFVQCECGTTEKIVTQNELLSGDTKSCGCLLSKEERSKRVSGENNPMFGITGEKNHRWDPERTSEQRKKERKDHQYYIWRKMVYERDHYTCKCCGDDKGGNLVAHHIYNYKDFPLYRYDVSNGITLCTTCHEMYHSIYGKKDNTYEQFESFINRFFAKDSYFSLKDILGNSKIISNGSKRIKPYKVVYPHSKFEYFYTYDEIREKTGISVSVALKSVLHHQPIFKRNILVKYNDKIIHRFQSYQEAGRYFNCSGSVISLKIHDNSYESKKFASLNRLQFIETNEKIIIERVS